MINPLLFDKVSRILHRMATVGLACCLALTGIFVQPRPVQAATLIITSEGSVLPATVGQYWSMVYTAAGGTPPYTCSMNPSTSSLGMEFDSKSCTLYGTPTKPGEFQADIIFTDSANPQNTATQRIEFTAQVQTKISLEIVSSHPGGKDRYVAGYPVRLKVDMDFENYVPTLEQLLTFKVNGSASDGSTCTMDLDGDGKGECALIIPSSGPKTIEVTFTGNDNFRSSNASKTITVEQFAAVPALSAGRNHTCYLDSTGLMTCWGLGDAIPTAGGKDDTPVPQGTFRQISSGDYQTCGIKVDGSIACWGENTDVTLNIPAGKFVEISSGSEHACAVNTTGHLTCWGNLSEELANYPKTVKVESVSAGGNFDCAVRKDNRQPVCWGEITNTPQVAVKTLAAGNTHACAVKTDGQLTCWGSPAMTPPAGNTYTAVDSGSAYSCAQKSGGKIECWGSNNPNPDSSAAFDSFSSGFLHTCALKPDGLSHTLSCWGGENRYGEAPRITISPEAFQQYLVQGKTYSQTFTPSGGNAPYTVSAGGSLPAGLSLSGDTLSGTPTVPGDYQFTITAQETYPGSSLPLALTPAVRSYSTTVIDPATTLTLTLPGDVNAGSPAAAQVKVTKNFPLPPPTGSVRISSGQNETYTYCEADLDENGTAECNLYFAQPGQQVVTAAYAGDDYSLPSTATGQITVNEVEIAPAIGAGDDFSCSIDADGHVSCWGDFKSPQIPIPASGIFDQLDLGKDHACALGLNRMVTCWGYDGYGKASPPNITGITKVTAGNHHSCALTDRGRIACWGWDAGNRTNATTPPSGYYIDIDAGADHTCAVVSDGSVKCWGVSDNGRTSVPSDLLSRGKVTQVSAGGTFTCALHENGSIECWGGNGVIDSIRSEPTGVFTKVSAGEDFACGLKSDGSVTCWGNLSGAPEGAFTRIAAGFDHACGIQTNGILQCWGDNDRGQAPAIVIAPDSLPVIDVGQPWQTNVKATGGRIAQYSYRLVEGALPQGLTLNSNTGLISGTPTQSGIFHFTIYAQEASLTPAVAKTKSYSLTVRGLVDAKVESALPGQAMVGSPIRVSFSVRARPGYGMGVEPSGKVTVTAEGNRCEVTLTNGAGSCLMLFGSPGVKTISISYSGDGLYQPDDPQAGSLEYEVIPFSQPPQLITGPEHTYIHKSDGAVGCVGSGCLFDEPLIRLGAGERFDCGLRSDGSLVCRPTGAAALAPEFNSGPYIDMSVGNEHVCVLKIDGQIECQGDSPAGQASPPAGSYVSLSAGGRHTCALKENGEAVCWGDISSPPGGAFTQLVSGFEHTCGLRPGGAVECWDGAGPVSLPSSPAVFAQIAAGGAQTCGLDPDGKATCWPYDAPGEVYSEPGEFIALAAYDDHACALRDGLKLTCWGENDAGEAPQITIDPLAVSEIPALAYFEHLFNVSGGVKPLTAEVVAGKLPPGMDVDDRSTGGASQAQAPGISPQEISPAGMVLYGTPDVPGVYSFTVRWTDKSPYPLVMERSYTLTVTGGDLSVKLIPQASTGALERLDYRFGVVVTNHSLLPVPGGVVLTFDLPEGLQNIRADNPSCKVSGSKLACPLGAAEPSAPQTVWVTGNVAMRSGEKLVIGASVESTLPDWPEINRRDNTDRLEVEVQLNSTIFTDDFDQPPSAHWQGGTPETSPNGSIHYLSVPGGDTLRLDLTGLPDHKKLAIRFDLYIIGGWQGNQNPSGSGPAEWMFGLDGAPPVLDTSFSNDPRFNQAYPGRLPTGGYPAQEGSAATSVLGYESGGKPLPDARYELTYRIDHSDSELHLVFSSANLPAGAWWGLDRVEIKIDSGLNHVRLPLISNME